MWCRNLQPSSLHIVSSRLVMKRKRKNGQKNGHFEHVIDNQVFDPNSTTLYVDKKCVSWVKECIWFHDIINIIFSSFCIINKFNISYLYLAYICMDDKPTHKLIKPHSSVTIKQKCIQQLFASFQIQSTQTFVFTFYSMLRFLRDF